MAKRFRWLHRFFATGSPKRTETIRRTRPRMERLEDRCCPAGTLTITALQGPDTLSATVPAATEGAVADPSINAAFTDTNAVSPANLTVTINYGDGTAASTNQGASADPNLIVTQVGGAGGTTYTVTDSHTFPEESGSTVPPFAFTMTLTVTENANAANTDTQSTPAEVFDASLTPFSAFSPVSAGITTGGDAGNATTAAQAEASFEAAIGGPKNTLPAPQPNGFRVITWDGVKTDGTDSVAGPGSTTPIPAGSTHTVGIPLNRFQGSGVSFGAVYAVSNDGFVDENPSVAGLFPAFTSPNIFAMFNDNGIDFDFVTPSSTSSAPMPATTRGFGAIFLNVQHAGSTTITFMNGATVLDTLVVPTNATPGSAIFAGELFTRPIVTHVLLTLGDGVIFKFDGTTVTAGAANSATNNLVATDDFVFPEPVPQAAAFSPVEGQAFSGEVGLFSDLDPNGASADYTAIINWGDGVQSVGSISGTSATGFSVSGTHTYAEEGTKNVTINVQDFGGASVTLNNTANVAEQPVGIDPGALDLQAGVDLGTVQVATFVDPAGPEALSTYTADIAWGDGMGDRGTITFDASTNVFRVFGSHVYGHEGQFPLTVTVYEDNVGSAAATGGVSVADAPVFLTSFSVPPIIASSVSGQIATFVDYDNSGVPSDFRAAINWGDNTTTFGTITETGVDAFGHVSFAVSSAHIFATTPTSAARITITDLRGGTSTTMANDGSDAVETTVFFDQATGTFKVIRYTYR